MALLLVSGVLPTLHIVRRGVDENIAFLLAGFNIILSDDRQEVVRIVMYYLWCVESESVVFLCFLYLGLHRICAHKFKRPSFIKFYIPPSPCISPCICPYYAFLDITVRKLE